MNIGPWQLLIVALVILVLFGRGRISEMMGDFGKGIKSFKQGMTEEEKSSTTQAQIPQQTVDPQPVSETKSTTSSN
ncbi:Sec-independent protein translocase subunit TatA [Novosphingobium aquimarinum]|uniref:Sec-independent protein translocase subunit TatA n=1 Tax=Novosphingobium aquimarinum TaxID=2682494 RepID=UPI0012EB2EE6|nr:Sec-independent protein translocase subunit TatA [Novosphingobium aquimarinum]